MSFLSEVAEVFATRRKGLYIRRLSYRTAEELRQLHEGLGEIEDESIEAILEAKRQLYRFYFEHVFCCENGESFPEAGDAEAIARLPEGDVDDCITAASEALAEAQLGDAKKSSDGEPT